MKFVPAVCAGVLAVVDQHVCLERLRAEVAPRPDPATPCPAALC